MSTNQQSEFRGHKVIDSDGEVIGTVSDVLYDDHVVGPKWLVIDPGILRKERLVPIEGSYETKDGKIVLPFDKKWVKDGPTVNSEHYPDSATTQLAAQHYHVES